MSPTSKSFIGIFYALQLFNHLNIPGIKVFLTEEYSLYLAFSSSTNLFPEPKFLKLFILSVKSAGLVKIKFKFSVYPASATYYLTKVVILFKNNYEPNVIDFGISILILL